MTKYLPSLSDGNTLRPFPAVLSAISIQIRSLGAILFLLLAVTAHGKEIQKFDAKPVRIDDRFETDTLKDYQTTGEVRWSTLKLTIPAGGALVRQKVIEADFRCEVDVWPTKFDAQQQCVSQVRFIVSNGWELVIAIHRVKRDAQVARQVLVAEIQRSGQGSEPDVEQLKVSPGFTVSGDVERWSLRYNGGLIEVRCNDQVVALACGQAFTSWCHAVALTQVAGETEVTRFSLQGREAGYSNDQQKLYEQTISLRAQAEEALAAGDVKLAIRTEQQCIPIMEQAFGKDYVAIALTHQWIAEIADNLGRYAAAKRFFSQSADIFAKSLGESHPQTLRARGWVGYEDAMLGNLDQGEATLRPATQEYARIAGGRDAGTRQLIVLLLNVLNMQAANKLEKKNFAEHVRYGEEIAALFVVINGPNSIETRDSQISVDVSRQIEKSDPATQTRICEILDSITHANTLLSQGDVAGANRVGRETLVECRKVLGKKHPVTANALVFVGDGEINSGNSSRGLRLLEEAVECRKELYGEEDSTFAYTECMLASAYSQTGRYDDATRLFDHAIKMLQHENERPSLAVANALSFHGAHLLRIDKLQNAHQQLTASLRAYQETGASSDPNAIVAFERLADVYRANGDSENAENILKTQELLLKQGEAGANATSLTLLTTQAKHLYLRQKYDDSVTEYHKALTQVARVYGQRSHTYETTLEGLFEVYLAQRNPAGIENVLRELLDFARLRREAVFSSSSVQQQFEHSASDRAWLNRLMALAANDLLSDSAAYERVLAIKGAVTLNQRRIQLAASRVELRPLLVRRQEVSAQITALLSQPVTAATSGKIVQLARTRDQVDIEMAGKSEAYRQISERLTIAGLRELLPSDTVVVDYVEFERPASWLERLFSSAPQRLLAAFVISKSGGVRLVNLGPAVNVDQALLAWARAMGAEVENMGPAFNPRLERATDDAGVTLRKLVWDPIQNGVANAGLVVVSPDGLLTLCPFAAFPTSDGQSYLIEKLSISHLPAIGLLPELFGRQTQPDSASLLVVDDVNYDDAEDMPSRSVDTNRLSFAQLPTNAGLEIDPVSRYFEQRFPKGKNVQLTQRKANEKNLRIHISQATVIHLSTHGFCLPLSQLLIIKDSAEAQQPMEFDPLVSGVALAGANHSTYVDGLSDGILWASEISTLDLSGVDLVTLSACQTATGDVVAGEGLQGAQRALLVAGASTSLTSLWSVEHEATRSVMEHFYRSAWADRRTKSDAIREAMVYMLREYPWWSRGSTAAKGHRCPPWLWSSWVLYGDWR